MHAERGDVGVEGDGNDVQGGAGAGDHEQGVVTRAPWRAVPHYSVPQLTQNQQARNLFEHFKSVSVRQTRFCSLLILFQFSPEVQNFALILILHG